MRNWQSIYLKFTNFYLATLTLLVGLFILAATIFNSDGLAWWLMAVFVRLIPFLMLASVAAVLGCGFILADDNSSKLSKRQRRLVIASAGVGTLLIFTLSPSFMFYFN